MAVPFQKQRMTIEEFQRLGKTEERLELIYGEVVEMSPIGPNHSAVVRRLIRLFSLRLSSQALVDAQSPIVLREQESEPQPDLNLLRLQEDFYSSGTPEPGDLFLSVEVADSSLSYDRNVKMRLYAEAGVPESWLVDLNSETIWVYRRPSPTGYRDVRPYHRGDSIAPEAFPETSFTVDEILG
jgi:Uma2 family endonuclease